MEKSKPFPSPPFPIFEILIEASSKQWDHLGMKNNRKLLSYWINRNYQGKFLVLFGGFILLQTGLFFYTMEFIYSEVTAVVRRIPDVDNSIFEELKIMKTTMVTIFGVSYTITLILFLIIAFRFTHKTAGALFHFKKSFEVMSKKGELQELSIRDGDFFLDVQESFNEMVKKVKS